ncbi:hypothetical protein HDU87_000144 [Geranomyces variabilis]|uniref:Aminotransferase class V domain-containing protein n=1 Tax=Geranomyces variabilis TaxID=109894 RepID=A0AAD5TS26_9FUNG|nr:hypothetical protein HDU87_000144 [Geranomyces variabilis]
MSAYIDVANWLKLPDKPPDDQEGNGGPYYSPPENQPFEEMWEKFFAIHKPPAFGSQMRQQFFPLLTGNLPASTNPDLSPATTPNRPLPSPSRRVTFLAHGSYGATARPSLDVARQWSLTMEASPVRFFYETLFPYLVRSQRSVAKLVGASPEDCVLVTNVEVGMGAVFSSILLHPGDKIVAFDVTYQAVLFAAQRSCERAGAELLTMRMTFPVTKESVLTDVRKFLDGQASQGGKIRLAVLQHITSPTAIVLPVKDLVRVFHERDIPVMIDGAHAIGQLPLALADLNADYYVSNGHKWLCSPRGTAILHVRRDQQSGLNPLVATWGHPYSASLAARFIWQGTADYSAQLAFYTTVRFWEWLGYERTIKRNAELARWCGRVLVDAWETNLLVEEGEMTKCSMRTIRIPPPYKGVADGSKEIPLGDILFARYGIEVPFFTFRDARWVRVSTHMYNEKEDCLLLGRCVLDALGFPSSHRGYTVLETARRENNSRL